MPAPTDMRRIFLYSHGRLLQLCSDVANLMADYRDAEKSHQDGSAYSDILRKGLILNACLLTWYKAQPPWFAVSITPLNEQKLAPWLLKLLSCENAPDVFHTHYNTTIGFLTGFYHVSRLKVHQVIAKSAMMMGDDKRANESIEEIAQVVQQLCCSIGSFFNDEMEQAKGGNNSDWETRTIRAHLGLRIILNVRIAMKVPWVNGTSVQKYLPFIEHVLSDFKNRWHFWAPDLPDVMA